MKAIEKERNKIKFTYNRTESWNRAIGIRWWSYCQDWKIVFSFWFFEVSWERQENDYPF